MNKEFFGEYTVEYAASKVGKLIVSPEGLTAKFVSVCVVATGEILRLAILSGDRYVPLGVMLPDGDKLRFHKKFSSNALKLKGIGSIDGCRLISKRDDLSLPSPPVREEAEIAPSPVPEPLSPAEPIPPPETEPESIPTLKPAAKPEPIPPPETEPEPIPVPEPIRKPEPAPPPEPESPPEPTHSWKALPTISEQQEAPLPRFSETDVEDVLPYPAPSLAVESEGDASPQWTSQANISALFSDQDLKTASQTVEEAMTRPGDDYIALAIPFEAGKPFPLMPIFCFGRSEMLHGRPHLVFHIKNGNLLSQG